MTAAKIMDVFARLPGCDGQAADAVSSYTQVKLEDAPRLHRIPKSECPDVRIRLPWHKMSQIMGKIEDLVVLLERNLYGHPSARLLWERQFEETLLEFGWEKFRLGKVCSFIEKQGLFLSVFVDAIKMSEKQNMAPRWKKLMENVVDIDEPTSFLTMKIWGVLSVNANRMKQLLNRTRRCLSHVFLLEQQKTYWGGKITNNGVVLRHDGHAQKSVERYCVLANKKVEQLYKVSHPCLDDHKFKQEELETVGELTEVCSQIVFNACAWHELEDLTSCGHSASLRGQWQNGLRQVTNA